MRDEDLTQRVIGAAFEVHNQLGGGFLEKVYENALFYELGKREMRATQQTSLEVCYDGRVVGHFVADLIVEDRVLVELKAIRTLEPAHTAQCINYLRATGLQTCLLMNFAKPRVEFKRISL